MRTHLLTLTAVLLTVAVAPAQDKDGTPIPKVTPWPYKTSIGDELHKIVSEAMYTHHKSLPTDEWVPPDRERAIAESLLHYNEAAIKFAADHPDTPEGRHARRWAAGSLAQLPPTAKGRRMLDALLAEMAPAERAELYVPLARSLTRQAGRPGVSRGEADAYIADAERLLTSAVETLTASKTPLRDRYLRQAESALHSLRHLGISTTAPEATGLDLAGKAVKLSDYRGKVVVLDFWYLGCVACKAMIPHERAMVERFRGKPLEVISIDVGDDKEDVEKFLAKTPMPWTHWLVGRTSGIVPDWKVSSYPTIYVLDAKGVIRFADVRYAGLEKAVEVLLAEMGEEVPPPAKKAELEPAKKAEPEPAKTPAAAKSPLAAEFQTLHQAYFVALNKAKLPASLATPDEERASIETVLKSIEPLLAFAAAHEDTPEGKRARGVAVGYLSAYPVVPRSRELLAEQMPKLTATEKAAAEFGMARGLTRHAGRPGLTAAEVTKCQAEAEAIFERLSRDGGEKLAERAAGLLDALRTLGVGRTAPEAVSQTLDGKPVKLSDYRGKVTVLDFWHVGCMPCRQMIPQLRAMMERSRASRSRP
ncbi:MAG: TlpA disulfide reductase family protein [Gemmataceae bacterium]